MNITNRPNNRPPRDIVERVSAEEALAFGAQLSETLSMGRQPAAKRARVHAWRRILRETGCSVSGLADVWGCDRQAIEKAMSRPEKPKGEFPIIDEPGHHTLNRLSWQYGPDRAMRIASGEDEATNADIQRWNSL